jgi:hypothetical protein
MNYKTNFCAINVNRFARINNMPNNDTIRCDNCGEKSISYEKYCKKNLCSECLQEEERVWESSNEFSQWLKWELNF